MFKYWNVHIVIKYLLVEPCPVGDGFYDPVEQPLTLQQAGQNYGVVHLGLTRPSATGEEMFLKVSATDYSYSVVSAATGLIFILAPF